MIGSLIGGVLRRAEKWTSARAEIKVTASSFSPPSLPASQLPIAVNPGAHPDGSNGSSNPACPLRADKCALLQHRGSARQVCTQQLTHPAAVDPSLPPSLSLSSLLRLTTTLPRPLRTARNSKPLEVIGTYDPVPKRTRTTRRPARTRTSSWTCCAPSTGWAWAPSPPRLRGGCWPWCVAYVYAWVPLSALRRPRASARLTSRPHSWASCRRSGGQLGIWSRRRGELRRLPMRIRPRSRHEWGGCGYTLCSIPM